ncbi:hypothetical protein ALC57_12084 [Trachymyrmex cornetzi]|uniref:Uncharacterized protein n=1 Tax=Trachymyrmex cornetzi TaxID=471704 RepID=A0A151J1G8_9HYME|nr:hypothetical protein ALC57_12084 [Trachymyrmex cornetzi]
MRAPSPTITPIGMHHLTSRTHQLHRHPKCAVGASQPKSL